MNITVSRSRPRAFIVIAGLTLLAVAIGVGVGTSLLLRSFTPFAANSLVAQEREAPTKKQAPEELRNPLLKMFQDGIVGDKNIEQADRDRTTQILREADPLLLRVKQENRRALKQMRQISPRFHPHGQVERNGEDYRL